MQRVLIFLLGSLGDTLVALPAFHLVARQFPTAERRVLTDVAASAKAASMESLLDGTDLVQGYYAFPPRVRGSTRRKAFLALAREIRAWQPQVLVYLHEQRGLRIAWRDAAVFRLLGIRRLVGIPLTPSSQRSVFDAKRGQFEHRAEYLDRRLQHLGDCRLSQRSSWDLRLSAAERARAGGELDMLRGSPGILAMSIGTKVDTNDWGDEKWRGLLTHLSTRLPGWGLVAIGAAVESARTEALLTAWRGPRRNVCGMLSVRESAALLAAVAVFIGHDSGPMHLGAAVGARCVAIFSARNLPGRWFPYGPLHTVFYKRTDCAGCLLSVCTTFQKKCIAAVTVDEVTTAVLSGLSARSRAAAGR